jgi:serine/alanine racemase
MNYVGLDYFRLIAAFLIVAIHTSPLTSVSPTSDFILTRIIARVGVPFFFMITGFFLSSEFLDKGNTSSTKTRNQILKISKLYAIAILLYLPLNIYTGYFKANNISLKLLKDIIFNGTFYHLWYLPASILGIGLLYVITRFMKNKGIFIFVTILYVLGLLGDSYFGLVEKIKIIDTSYKIMFHLFDYTRNGIFMAPIFIYLGVLISSKEKHRKKSISTILIKLLISSVLLITEAFILQYHSLTRHDSMYVMLIPTMYFLFQLLLLVQGNANKNIRKIATLIYIIHPMCIIIVRGFAKFTNLELFFIQNSILHYLAVCMTSVIFSILFIILHSKRSIKNNFDKGRAWIEINLNHLRYNADYLRNTLRDGCQLMAVVKANAYGHGDIMVAHELNRVGVSTFAVATLAEGVHLRKKGIKGDILVLGYTHPNDFNQLVRYHLTQSMIDFEYSTLLNSYGKTINAHIKVDTGMHRLGEDCDNINHIKQMFHLENVKIKGIYSHLCVSDQLNKDDISYTEIQIENFYNLIHELIASGYNPGKLHIQSSYGVLNYPELKCDYARIGIALYGVLSSDYDKTKLSPDLLPVLSLKARLIMTKTIQKGQPISYGRQYIAPNNMLIGVVAMGYADGIPRNLTDGCVLINGKKVPIIGRICMDQFIVDLTQIPEASQDTIVTIIGQDGNDKISAEEIARKSGTITNELLSRLGNRLERIYLNA